MSPFDPLDVRSTPYGAPLVPSLPIRLRRTEILDRRLPHRPRRGARRFVPEPLAVADDLCVRPRLLDARRRVVRRLRRVGVPAPGAAARRPRGRLLAVPRARSDGAVAAGRELYGQPKKAGRGRARAERRPAGRAGSSRNGIDIATATMCFKQTPAEPDALERLVPGSALNVNLRVLPEEARAGSAASWCALVRRTSSCTRPGRAPGPLELRPNAQVPVHLLPVRRGRARPAPAARPDAPTRHGRAHVPRAIGPRPA